MTIENIEQARLLVVAAVESSWEVGTLAFPGVWHEDDQAFMIRPEPLEWLRDRDISFRIVPGACAVVSKESGEVSWEVFHPVNDFGQRLRKATRHEEDWPFFVPTQEAQPDHSETDSP